MTEHTNQGPAYQPPPQQPQGGVYGAPAQPTTPPRKRRAPTWLIVATAIIVGVCGIGTVAAVATSGTDLDQPPAPGQREAPAEPAVEKPDPPAEPDYYQPKPKDFKLSIKTLSKECFGSAGCLIDFRVELAQVTTGMSLDPSATYELTYEIIGGEDAYINTLTITGEEYSTQETESVSTASDVELSAEITDVSEF